MFINEIFSSIQGETSFAGIPCLFIRTTGCNLRCSYCDTTYAYKAGRNVSIGILESLVKKSRLPLVSVTGGEPLLQDECRELLKIIVSNGKTALLETNGSIITKGIGRSVIKIVDVKCPGSGEEGSFLEENFRYIRAGDELKFVITNRRDYEWAKEFIRGKRIKKPGKILFSPAAGKLKPSFLASWILRDSLSVRLQLQMHRIIWPGRKRKI